MKVTEDVASAVEAWEPSFSLSGSGFDTFNVANPPQGPAQTYYDQSGNYWVDDPSMAGGGGWWDPDINDWYGSTSGGGGNYSLGGSGFDTFNVGTVGMSPEPFWDNTYGAWNDGLGHLSYDDGATWVPIGSAPPDPFSNFPSAIETGDYTVPNNSYSVSDFLAADYGNDTYTFAGPGFEEFNVASVQPEPETPWGGMTAPWAGGGLSGGPEVPWGEVASTFADVAFQPRGMSAAGGALPTDNSNPQQYGDITGTIVEDAFSGNELVRDLTGYDLGELPYGLGYVTDEGLAPATWITAGLGPSVPLLGSTFGGRFGARLGGEAAVGALGLAGAEMAAGDVGESIPLFGEQPAWVRGIEGGLLGGIGAIGAARAGRGIVDDLVAPSTVDVPSIYKPSVFRVGEEAQFPPSVARDIPPGRPIPQVAGAADIDDTALNPVRQKVVDALEQEYQFRKSGQAEDIKSVKRSEQARGIDAAQLGATAEETIANVRAGARVGEFFERTPGLRLSDEDYNAAIADVWNNSRGFDKLKTIEALDKLQNGVRLQPKEITLLGEYYGAEFAKKVKEINASLIRSTADLTDDDLVEIVRRSEIDGRKVAILEVRAKRQHELADELTARAKMDPTNQRLKKAAEEARAKAIRQENEADRIIAERAERVTRNLPGRQAAYIEQGEVGKLGTFEQALRRDKALAAQEAAVRKAAEDEWIRGLEFRQPDEFVTQMARLERGTERRLSAAQESAKRAAADRAAAEWARSLDYPGADEYARMLESTETSAMRELGRLQDTAHRRQMRASNKARLNASDEQVVNKARDIVAKLDVSDNLKSQLLDTIDIALRQNRSVLDIIESSDPNFLRRAYAAATGEVSDSYTSALISRRAILEGALQMQGTSEDLARRVGKLVQESELMRRFPDGVPDRVKVALDESKLDYADRGLVSGAASISQEMKNTQFGIGDMAVFGQQGLKLFGTNGPQILAALANRALHIVNLGLDESSLPKRVLYQLDGVAQSSHAITDLTRESTIFHRVPGLGGVDKVAAKTAEFLTDLQFNRILTPLRNLAFEGNLVMAKVAGADITDPVVRARAAQWANAASGAGKLAQDAKRAQAEKAFLLSPSMRRAQVQQIGQVARGLTAGSRTDRVLAAATILSAVSTTLLIGKVLNDYVGIEEFEFDPSKKGFGNITLPNGTVINLFPQEQIPKALARSIRVLAEDGFNEADAKAIAKEWGNLGIASASPAARVGLGYLNVGFDEGYRWGDFNPSWKQALSDALLPPIGQSLWKEGADPLRTPLEFLGVNSYPESQYDALNRKVKNDPQFGGREYSDLLLPLEKQAAQEKYGQLEPFGPEGQRAAEVLQGLIRQQEASDSVLRAGVTTPDERRQWREDYSKRKEELRIRNDEIYQNLDLQTKDPTLAAYYQAIEGSKGLDGMIDWDKVDAYRAGLSDADNKKIDENTGLIRIKTDMTQQFEKDRGLIEKSGYFERQDAAWRAVQAQMPETKPYKDYDAWRADLLEKAVTAWTKQGLTPEFAAKEAEKFIDKMDPAKAMEYYGGMWRDKWMVSDPYAAFLAWRWGYWNPNKEQAEWLNTVAASKKW